MRIPRTVATVGAAVAGLTATAVVLAGTAGAATAAPTTILLSRNQAGVDGNLHSMFPGISRDGRFVTFRSNATNLIPRKPNEPPARDVYLWDRTSGQLEAVSVDTAGHRLPGHSGGGPSPVTSSGRFVAFDSLVARPTPADPGHQNFDVFLRTRFGHGAGRTDDVTPGLGGAPANGSSSVGGISEDGRFVALTSAASNLVAGDSNGRSDVFLRDNGYHMTIRVSVSSTGVAGNDDSGNAQLSANGRYVVYVSRATNLVPGDTNGVADIFLFDRFTRRTERISVDSAGKQLPGDSDYPSVSDDGRYVAFGSFGSTNPQVYVRDRVAGTTTVVSVNNHGVPGDGLSGHPSISGSGRYVSFQSFARNLVPGVNSGNEIYVRDLVKHKTSLGSAGNDGSAADGPTFFAQVSDAGVAFQSLARNLGGHANGNYQVYLRTF